MFVIQSGRILGPKGAPRTSEVDSKIIFTRFCAVSGTMMAIRFQRRQSKSTKTRSHKGSGNKSARATNDSVFHYGGQVETEWLGRWLGVLRPLLVDVPHVQKNRKLDLHQFPTFCYFSSQFLLHAELLWLKGPAWELWSIWAVPASSQHKRAVQLPDRRIASSLH